MWTKAALVQAASLLALSSLLIEANGLALPANSTSLVKREGGINCRGSSTCGLIGTFSNGRIVQTIDGYIGSIDYTRVYENGQQIACESNVCAFLKGVPDDADPVLGYEIWQLMGILSEHGCHNCGSVPVNALKCDNDNGSGELTINYVHNDFWGPDPCTGLCNITKPNE